MAIAKKKEGERGKATARDYKVLIRPVITEKSSIVGGDGSCVVFRVDMMATKHDVKGAVERIFDVNVKAVRTCTFSGKVKRTTGAVGQRKSFKKAYVTLQPGEMIDVVEGL